MILIEIFYEAPNFSLVFNVASFFYFIYFTRKENKEKFGILFKLKLEYINVIQNISILIGNCKHFEVMLRNYESVNHAVKSSTSGHI